MTLTMPGAPLSSHPTQSGNFTIRAPAHRLLFEAHPRRVRALVEGVTVLDSVAGRLLHESQMLPVLYAPLDDFAADALVASDTSTHCPFKGDARYWSLRVGERTVEDAVWGYPEPLEAARWLAGFAAMPFDAADTWLEEDEEVHGHLRDPYHRVDARPSSRRVEVRRGDAVVAASDGPVLVFETGLPTRAYLPREALADGVTLEPSETTSWCPYKGGATYGSLRLPDGAVLEDAAWSYEDPLDGASALRGLVSLDHDDLEVSIA